MHIMFFSCNGLVFDRPMPAGMIVNIRYYCTNSCRIRWGQMFSINKQNCWSMLSFSSRTMQHLISIVMCKIWYTGGAVRCWHIIPTLHILLRVITCCLHMWKNTFRVSDLNQKLITTLLSLPLFIIWPTLNAELQLIIYHIDGKSVWTLMVVTLCKGHICSVVILYFVITIKSCTKLLKWPAYFFCYNFPCFGFNGKVNTGTLPDTTVQAIFTLWSFSSFS
jgi:hypothetical protein